MPAAGQGRDRRPGVAGRRVGRNEEHGVVDRGALEPAARRRDARRVAHGQHGDKMFAFEYLRIVERDGGLVYVAQPGGSPPTEFVLTELDNRRAVFDNPRHDYPQRIVYELSAEGGLSAIDRLRQGPPPALRVQARGQIAQPPQSSMLPYEPPRDFRRWEKAGVRHSH